LTPQLCLKKTVFSTVNYSTLFTTGEKYGLAVERVQRFAKVADIVIPMSYELNLL